ncbi:hypothetical protein L579_2743 [Pantoea sp. AS-PWVM4]|nr:hypothetical protein L579_2743 [Pantoea sp. AS-PWVM4]
MQKSDDPTYTIGARRVMDITQLRVETGFPGVGIQATAQGSSLIDSEGH